VSGYADAADRTGHKRRKLSATISAESIKHKCMRMSRLDTGLRITSMLTTKRRSTARKRSLRICQVMVQVLLLGKLALFF
jgi:hypothetical protein